MWSSGRRSDIAVCHILWPHKYRNCTNNKLGSLVHILSGPHWFYREDGEPYSSCVQRAGAGTGAPSVWPAGFSELSVLEVSCEAHGPPYLVASALLPTPT